MSEADKERDRIVAWLDESAAEANDTRRSLNARRKLTFAMEEEWKALMSFYSGVSAAIARNEHRSADNGE